LLDVARLETARWPETIENNWGGRVRPFLVARRDDRLTDPQKDGKFIEPL
jgi:hypothetical protein